LYRHSAISGAAEIAAAIIACSVAAYLWRFMTPSGILTRTAALWLIVLGFVVFYLGFGLFFPNIGWDFSTAGSGNRVAIASAIGAACVLVGIVGLICSAIPGGLKQVRVFSIAMGLACGANCLVVSGIGSYWVDAGAQVKGIVNSLKEDVPTLPQGSTLLLDGFCRNRGPALLLVSDWDATGAVRIALADDSLTGDVVSDDATFGVTAVDTMMDGHPEGHYPYSDHLFVYNARYRVLKPLPSQEAASAYLRAMNPTGDSGCTTAHDREVAGIL
jgi:hypothetical protein